MDEYEPNIPVTPLTPMYEAFHELSERDQRRFAHWAASQIDMELIPIPEEDC